MDLRIIQKGTREEIDRCELCVLAQFFWEALQKNNIAQNVKHKC